MVTPSSGIRNGPSHNRSGVTWSKMSRNFWRSSLARLTCSGLGSTNSFPTCNRSVANRPCVTATLTPQLTFSPLADSPVIFSSYSPGAFSRSTPSKPLRCESSAPSRHSGTLRPPQSPRTSASGFAIFNAISSKLPWLASVELRRNVVPAVQDGVLSARALAGNRTALAAKIMRAKLVRQNRTSGQSGKLISVAASPSRAPPPVQIVREPPSIP